MNELGKNKGITLIALIITIIVLLILVGVSVATLTGDNGILSQATESKDKTEIAEEKERIRLAVLAAKIGNKGYETLEKDKLESEIKKQFGSKIVDVVDNGDTTFMITVNNRQYYIDEDSTMIEQNHMYRINNESELKAFRDEVNNGKTFEDSYVYLTSNIVLDNKEEWIPIGTYLNTNTSVGDETNTPFKGTFDGKGYSIDGIKITSKEKGKGVFGLVDNGTVKNLGVGKNCVINVGVSYGSITGYAHNGTRIKNCYNEANIEADSTNIGGIVGTVTKECIIKKCYNIGMIKGNTFVGGIVGNNIGNIESCFNTGNVIATITNCGGITGKNSGSIENCYNTGDLIGSGTNIGGIVGYLDENAKVSNTYNIGTITGTNGGGIIGVNVNGSIKNSYYATNIVNGANGKILQGTTVKTIEEMKEIENDLGNAFKKDTNHINNEYPILNWQ